MTSKDPNREQPPPRNQSHSGSILWGIAPGVTGSLAIGATYFGVIESTKSLIPT
ncbi:hypothetical protein F2Q69_00026878 [Brassica cretica]|uniref:Peptidase S50 domain-containing protein n=1 Tax=Brassica cretica TaxID=69181 RepID=A0A8S9S2Z2_BRACR|nr:hypothetical protein F2Q69_00026878 [Brassica cretica]